MPVAIRAILSTGSGAPRNDGLDFRGRDKTAAGSDLTTSAGGRAGFTTGTAWDAVADQSEFMTDLNEYLASLTSTAISSFATSNYQTEIRVGSHS